MRRYAASAGTSIAFHVLILGWMASAWVRWREAAVAEPPAAIGIEVETVGLVGPGWDQAASAAETARPSPARRRPIGSRAARPGWGGSAPGVPPGPAASAAPPPPAGAAAATETGVEPGTGWGAPAGSSATPRAGAGGGAGGSEPGGAGATRQAEDAARAARILALVQARRRYPLFARRQGLEGTVELVFRIAPDGQVYDVQVVQSAGAWLDEAAKSAVISAAPLPRSDRPVRIPIRFRLSEGRAIR